MPRISVEPNQLKSMIMEACITVFNEKGMKFTMDDIAKICHISKKTMYLVYADKESMILEMVDYVFNAIKQCEQEIYNDPSMETVEKIRRIMIVLPDRYKEIDLSRIANLKGNYPDIYKKMSIRLENDWEATIELLEQGMKEGKIRNISIPVLRAIIGGAIESLLGGDLLIRNHLTYNEALDELIAIVMDGIRTREGNE